MTVSFIQPIEQAWERTHRILFRPFDIERWLVIAFAAFLAGLGGWMGFGFGPGRRDFFRIGADDLVRAPYDAVSDLLRHSLWFALGIPIIVLGILLAVALLWVGSRGKFVFLDNMVNGRGAIAAPWSRYGSLGDSLFLWRIGFAIAVILVMAVVVTPLLVTGRWLLETFWPAGALIVSGATVLALLVGVAVAYALLFLDSFVVPLMYSRGLSTNDAWRAFLPLLRAHPVEFALYGLVIVMGMVLLAMAIVVSSIPTCCILPILLSVPYVGSVILLPASGLYRLYTLEFLAQFGQPYSILPTGEDDRAPSPGETDPSDPGTAPPPPPAPPSSPQ